MIRANPARIVFAVFSVAIMGCSDTGCTLLASTFHIIFERAEWTPADYAIELEYERNGVLQKRTCRARVPWLEVVGDEADGGTMLLDLASAPEDFHRSNGGFLATCDYSQFQAPRLGAAYVAVGRAIVVTVPDTPSQVDLVVRDAEEVVLERELRLDYEDVPSEEEGCAGHRNAVVRVGLP